MKEFVARGGDPNLPAAIIDNGTRPNQRVVTGRSKRSPGSPPKRTSTALLSSSSEPS